MYVASLSRRDAEPRKYSKRADTKAALVRGHRGVTEPIVPKPAKQRDTITKKGYSRVSRPPLLKPLKAIKIAGNLPSSKRLRHPPCRSRARVCLFDTQRAVVFMMDFFTYS